VTIHGKYLIGQCSRYSNSLLAGRSGDRIPVGARFSASVPDRSCGPSSILYNGYWISFSRVKRPGRDVNHRATSSAEVKERVELYIYSPSGPSWPLLGRNLSFLFNTPREQCLILSSCVVKGTLLLYSVVTEWCHKMWVLKSRKMFMQIISRRNKCLKKYTVRYVLYIYIHIYVHIYTYICNYIYIHIYVHIYTCICNYIYTHTHIYIYMYIYTYTVYVIISIYIYIHTYVHIYVLSAYIQGFRFLTDMSKTNRSLI
jgi:hypothetical protein